ncbi:MAG: helix-turn-helix transcriptional regulator [Rhodobacter sp.]|jgi:transcriptional regulator with XRE-family HTH domain|nr:helix-turn-helix transcriptional regulator [Rhodobacter sp.]
MSRRTKGALQSVARRLRFIRGDDTQEAFAKRVGVSRSALANYETGRSKPDDFTLSRIAEKAGVPIDYFQSSHEPSADNSPAAVIGAYIEGVPDWTEDEAALVRILRLCSPDTVQEVLQMVTSGASRQEFLVTLDAVFVIKEDIQRLLDAGNGLRSFEKGSLSTFPEGSARHGIGFKERSAKGPT